MINPCGLTRPSLPKPSLRRLALESAPDRAMGMDHEARHLDGRSGRDGWRNVWASVALTVGRRNPPGFRVGST